MISLKLCVIHIHHNLTIYQNHYNIEVDSQTVAASGSSLLTTKHEEMAFSFLY